MAKSTKIILGLFLGFILTIGLTIGWIVSIKFQAGTFENTIVASNQNLQKNINSYQSYSGLSLQ